jgi:hypothetical protein
MTNHEPTSPNAPTSQAGERDLGELSRAILAGERVQPPPPPPLPPRRIVTTAVKPLKVPALVAQVLLAAWVPFVAVAVAFAFMQRSLAQRVIDNPTQVRFSEIVADNDRVHAINVTFTTLIVITGIGFIVWFRLAYWNLDALGAPRRHGVGWAIGSWLVPVVNLYMPKRIADDINAGNEIATPGAPGQGMPRPKSALIFCWWAAWIISFALRIVAGNARDATSPQEVLDHNGLYLAEDLALLVAALLAVLVVRRITKGQEAVVAAARQQEQ